MSPDLYESTQSHVVWKVMACVVPLSLMLFLTLPLTCSKGKKSFEDFNELCHEHESFTAVN